MRPQSSHAVKEHAGSSGSSMDISPHQLEMVRVHRALTALRSDGLPQDVIVKPHYYRIK